MKFNKILETTTNIVLLILMLAAAVSYKGKLFGHKSDDLLKPREAIEIIPPSAEQLEELGLTNVMLEEEAKGTWQLVGVSPEEKIINTKAFSKGIYGFGGPVDMFLYVDKSKEIKQVLLQENYESPEFLESVEEKGIISQWIGKSPKEISVMEPDAVSGATLTSNAINRTIKTSITASSNLQSFGNWYAFIDTKTIPALLVIFLGLFVSFKAKKNKYLRTVQLLLNTIVLGFWCGKFISLNIMLGWISNGMNVLTSSVVLLMLLLSILMPLFFKKKSYYCNWVCPFGSAQELAGKLTKKKYHPGKKLSNVLKHCQAVVTLALFFCMWMGVATDIVDYEPFSAFLFKHASVAVLIIASLSLIIAVFTPRPWCKYVCPTGQILNWTNKMQ